MSVVIDCWNTFADVFWRKKIEMPPLVFFVWVTAFAFALVHFLDRLLILVICWAFRVKSYVKGPKNPA